MLKFYRSVLAAGAIAIGLAACGDDVTVTNPPPPPPAGVHNVTLAPSQATVAVGGHVQIAASVSADSGVATGLNWTSSDATIASVDANGLVTGVGVGNTTVVATSSADPTKSGAVAITVAAAPPGVTSFTVTPTAVTLNVAQTVTAVANIQTAAGVPAPTVTWTSLAPTVATVDQTGKITAVTGGTAVVTATITVGGVTQAQSIAVTVNAIVPASVTIAAVNQGASGMNSGCPGTVGAPVILSNVACQIDVNLNFNPGTQPVDSVAVYILPDTSSTIPAGLPAAAKQSFANNAATAGIINLSVNTAAFGKNPSNATDTTYYTNGPRQLVAAVFVHDQPTAPIAGNTNNVVSIVLNNTDGFAADIVKPTNCAASVVSGHAGLTYCGGPTADATVRLYPVFYTPGRSLSSTTSTVYTLGAPGAGNCSSATFFGAAAVPVPGTTRQINTGDAKTFGYTSGTAQVSCVGYENAAGIRDNVIVFSSQDNASNNFITVGFPTPPPSTPFPTLISNTIVFGATPDSLRLDYAGPSGVSAPSVVGSEGYNWVNDAVDLRAGSGAGSDAGVGVNPSTLAIVNVTGGAPGSPLPDVECAANPAGSGVCTVSGLAETNTNLGPPAGDGYKVAVSDVDLLGNPSNSSSSSAFGVDRSAPDIRYSTRTTLPSLYTDGGGIDVVDSTQYLAIQAQFTPGTDDSVRTEAFDGRSGLSRFVTTQRVFNQGGTSLLSSLSNGSPGAALLDGYRPGPAAEITFGQAVPGYYTTTQYVVDRAGNASVDAYKRTVALDPGQPLVTGVSPVNNVAANQPVQFQIGAQNDLEVIDAKLRLNYPNLTVGDAAATPAVGILFPFPSGNQSDPTVPNTSLSAGVVNNIFATAFDASIVNPVIATMTLDKYTVSIQETCVGAALGAIGDATGPGTVCSAVASGFVGDPVPNDAATGLQLFKPANVTVAVRDVFGSFVSQTLGGPTSGVSNDFTSAILPAFLPDTGSYSVTYATIAPGCPAGGSGSGGPCVAAGINFRYDPVLSSASTRTFVAVEPLSSTLPLFERVELYGLNANNEWEFIQRINVPNPIPVGASCVTNTFIGGVAGCDNGLERFWKFQFNNVPTGTPAFTEYRALGVNPNGYGLFSPPVAP